MATFSRFGNFLTFQRRARFITEPERDELPAAHPAGKITRRP